jgi:O-antigen ligase
MPPVLALVLTTGFVAWLFLRDQGRRADASWALWLPLAWLFITGTRFVSQWLALGQWSGSTTSEDGSPLDAVVFGLLTLVGCIVLAQRRVAVGALMRQNPWVIALLVYGLLSVAWSDFPFVSLKRWIKALGNPVMALLVLTDPNPVKAFQTVTRRLAYVVLPFSVMFIKYFPEYGRGFGGWTGAAYNQGVALTKNGLGVLCLALGLALVWNLQVMRREAGSAFRRYEWCLTVGLLAMLAWLLYMSDSKTSQVALMLGIGVLVVLNSSPTIRSRFTPWFVLGVAVIVLAESMFDIYAKVIVALGRDPDLTDRTEVWADVLALQPSVLLGAGYEAFWLGERLQKMWSVWWWQPNQAHSGYIEMYANGGLIGLGLLLGMIVGAFRSIARDLKSDSEAEVDWARLRMALLLVIVVYNYTEATFKGVNPMWTLFYLVAWKASGYAMLAPMAPNGRGRATAPGAWSRRVRSTSGASRPSHPVRRWRSP